MYITIIFFVFFLFLLVSPAQAMQYTAGDLDLSCYKTLSTVDNVAAGTIKIKLLENKDLVFVQSAQFLKNKVFDSPEAVYLDYDIVELEGRKSPMSRALMTTIF